MHVDAMSNLSHRLRRYNSDLANEIGRQSYDLGSRIADRKLTKGQAKFWIGHAQTLIQNAKEDLQRLQDPNDHRIHIALTSDD